MNLTLSVDERLVERAREVARRQGSSLNELVRRYIEGLAGQRSGEDIARELRKQWAKSPGRSGGKKIRREDLYSGRI